MMDMHAPVTDRLRQRLTEIYGPAGEAWAPGLPS